MAYTYWLRDSKTDSLVPNQIRCKFSTSNLPVASLPQCKTRSVSITLMMRRFSGFICSRYRATRSHASLPVVREVPLRHRFVYLPGHSLTVSRSLISCRQTCLLSVPTCYPHFFCSSVRLFPAPWNLVMWYHPNRSRLHWGPSHS